MKSEKQMTAIIIVAVIIILILLLACGTPSGFPYEAPPTRAPEAMILWGVA